jgi:hypothetical protein
LRGALPPPPEAVVVAEDRASAEAMGYRLAPLPTERCDT